MEWKGHQQRKEVGPREGQDPTTNVEMARAKERALERASKRKVSPPKERERAKAKTRKVSQAENRTKIGKVYVETVPVAPENEIHPLFRTFGG